ncbi:hypothetical protein H072_7093 [Dactylellina haptotyla CBS 200.50]|uniref:Uncharacterized protein n=1 Tax=Dactylellina haptotyla (strain CBS 200.50) TaxID=1284197 RepID=S8A8J0_DACHA|nr:hypothetical protein H072_7093 [Dactylellina haptotyla CBS 200.50]
MHPLFVVVLSALVSQAFCNPVFKAPPYDPLKKRLHSHLDEIGVPFGHLMEHIKRNHAEEDIVHSREVHGNVTLTRYSIPDHIWDAGIESYPHEKRQVHLRRRNLVPPPDGTEGPHSLHPSLQKRYPLTGYWQIRMCLETPPNKQPMSTSKFREAAQFFCSRFSEYLQIFIDTGSGPEPPVDLLYGPWQMSDSSAAKCDVYFNFSHAPTFPWSPLIARCMDFLGELSTCKGEGYTYGGRSGIASKLGEGDATFSFTPNPKFLQDPFVV